MSSKHTPGPWTVEIEDCDDFAFSRGMVYDATNGIVAEVYAHTDMPTTEANARLLAAAPDLLAACDHEDYRDLELLDACRGTMRLLDLMVGQWPGMLAIDARALREQVECAIANCSDCGRKTTDSKNITQRRKGAKK